MLGGGIDTNVGVGAIAVHVAPGARQAALAHQVGALVRGFRIVGPEIPLPVIVSQARIGKSLLAADEVRKLHRVAHNEDRRFVVEQMVLVPMRRASWMQKVYYYVYIPL